MTQTKQGWPGTLKERTSCSSPASWAFLASACERRAYSSCSTLEIPKAAARRSALWPMVSDVENSATAGSYTHTYTHRSHHYGLYVERGVPPSKVDSLGMCTSGARWAIRMLPIRLSLWPRVLALLRDSMVFLILRLWRIGTSDMNSTPPATTVSHWPAAIRPTAADNKRKNKKMSAGNKRTHAAWFRFYASSPVGCIYFFKKKVLCVENSPEVIAMLEEMQAMVMVCAGILSENPAPMAAWNDSKQWKRSHDPQL